MCDWLKLSDVFIAEGKLSGDLEYYKAFLFANQFKDQFGTKQRGTLLAPTKNKDGTYTFNIRDHRGKIKPVTGRRSGDPDDAPVTLTKEEAGFNWRYSKFHDVLKGYII